MLGQANVLSGLAHGNIDIRQPGRGLPRTDSSFGSFSSAFLGLGKERVVGANVGHAVDKPAHGLDPGGYEDVEPADFTIDDAHINLGNARHGLALLWEQLLLAGLMMSFNTLIGVCSGLPTGR